MTKDYMSLGPHPGERGFPMPTGLTWESRPFDSVEEFKEACRDHDEVSDRMVEAIDWDIVQQMADRSDEFLSDAKDAFTEEKPHSDGVEENISHLLAWYSPGPEL